MAPQGQMRGAFGHYCSVKGLQRQALPSSDRFAASFSPKGRSLFSVDKTALLYYHYTVYKNKV